MLGISKVDRLKILAVFNRRIGLLFLFVLALYFYHAGCQKIFKQQQMNYVKYTSFKLRIWNEVATILLFAIVFLVVLKSAISWIWGVIGIILLGALLMLSIRLYKKIKTKNGWEGDNREISEDTNQSNSNK